MAWRLAKGLEQLRSQVNSKWPGRSKESDGSVGDTSHAARPSDHNPDSRGVVHAIDLTNDPQHGFSSEAFANLLLKNQDPRLSYVISNKKIGSGRMGPSPGVWRKYTGANAHDHHCHISITKAGEDDAKAWNLDGASNVPVPSAKPVLQTLREGSKGNQVKNLQAKLGVKADGTFGSATLAAVKDIQNRRGLVADGIVGPATWAIINE